MDNGSIEHRPVLVDEVLDWLRPEPGKRFLDGTLGLGGHTLAFLQRSQGGLEVLGLDQDALALRLAGERLERAGFAGQVHAENSSFAEFESILEQKGWDVLDGVLLDLGLSSLQVDDPGRGFSFLRDGPLDMRMNQRGHRQTAARLVNDSSQETLRRIIREYGEEPMAGRIARAIVEARQKQRLEGTFQLAEVVRRAYPAKRRAKSRNHPATKTFQALRIAVNQELDQLSRFLQRIPDFLAPGGRLAVISFHSLEDRLVKHAFKREARGCTCTLEQSACECTGQPRLRILTKKPVVPGELERSENPRSRSAKLRVAESLSTRD